MDHTPIILLCLTGALGFIACTFVMFLSERTQKVNEQEARRKQLEKVTIYPGDKVRVITPQQISGADVSDWGRFPELQKFGGKIGIAGYKQGDDPLWQKTRVVFENEEYGLFDDWQMQKMENL